MKFHDSFLKLWAGMMVISLAIFVSLVIVAIHFIGKFW